MKRILAAACLMAPLKASNVLACAVCFGNPQSAQTQSAMAGVLVMLGITLFVLLTVGSVAFTWARRARALDQAQGALARISR